MISPLIMNRVAGKIVAFALVFSLFASFAFSGAAAADSVTGSTTITGQANVTMVLGANPTFAATLIDGNNKSDTATLGITINDSRGTGAGWSIAMTSDYPALQGDNTKTLPYLWVSGATSACSGETCTAASNGATYNVTLNSTGGKVFSAAANSGMGLFTVTPTFNVSVPANAYVGTYDATIVVTLAQVP